MGRGVRAAAVMGQIRSALRSYAVEGLAPAQLLERLAAFTAALEGEHLITCVVGLFDAAAGSIELASAGHPPPLVVEAQGRTRMLAVDPGLPLGVPGLEPGNRYTATRLPLAPGDRLVLYTDGLVEGCDVPVGDGLRRLERGLGGMPPGSADDLCDAVLAVMGNVMRRPDPHDDDTAVLTLRVPPGCAAATAGGGVVRVCAALQDEGTTGPASSRRLVRETLAAHVPADLVDSAVLLVSELVTNALRHGGGPQKLSVDIDDGGVTVSVSDSSVSPPLERDLHETASGILPENGRGLILVAALADDWGWAQESSGKRVWFRLRTRSGAAAGTPDPQAHWLS
jgi:anti-sigma regulatory factor (Ser/Thr protein kinase)